MSVFQNHPAFKGRSFNEGSASLVKRSKELQAQKKLLLASMTSRVSQIKEITKLAEGVLAGRQYGDLQGEDRAKVGAWLKEAGAAYETYQKECDTLRDLEQEEADIYAITNATVAVGPEVASETVHTGQQIQKGLKGLAEQMGKRIPKLDTATSGYHLNMRAVDKERAEIAVERAELKVHAERDREEEEARVYRESMDWVQKILWKAFGPRAAHRYGE